jgi:hypothetical protein
VHVCTAAIGSNETFCSFVHVPQLFIGIPQLVHVPQLFIGIPQLPVKVPQALLPQLPVKVPQALLPVYQYTQLLVTILQLVVKLDPTRSDSPSRAPSVELLWPTFDRLAPCIPSGIPR